MRCAFDRRDRVRWLLLVSLVSACRCGSKAGAVPDVLFVSEASGSPQVAHWSADGGIRALSHGPTWAFTTRVGLLVEVDAEQKLERLLEMSGKPVTEWRTRARNPTRAVGRLAYEGDLRGLSNIVLMTDAGPALATDAREGDFEPAFRSDGQALFFTSSRGGSPGVYQLDLNDGGVVLVFNGPAEDTAPCPHPDGRRLAFLSNAEGRDQPHFVEGGSAPRRLASVGVKDLRWHPDGKRLFFTYQRPDDKAGIGFVTIGAETVTPIGASRADDELGDISDDGKWLVFSSRRDGNDEVYVMPIEGGAVVRVTNSPSSDTQPVFVRSP
jgi:Tol biopolymer transport system component